MSTTTAEVVAGNADTLPATPGQRIRVTHLGAPDEEPRLYPGATGTVTEAHARAVCVAWDDPDLDGVALLVCADDWDVLR